MDADNRTLTAPAPVGRAARRALVLACLVVPVIAAAAQGEASEILREAVERQQARLVDVHNYTLVRRINGREAVAYYERREAGGRATFEPVSPLRLALESGAFDDTPLAGLAPGGDVLGSLRSALTDAVTQAGAAALEQQLAGAAPGEVASLVDALIRPPKPGAGGGETIGSLVDVDAFKQALVEGALRVGMTQLASQVLGLPGDTGLALLKAVRGKASPGELLGELARTALGGAAGGMPGGGPGGGAMMAGNPLQAGIGAVTRLGGQFMARKSMSAADRILTPRYMNDVDFYSAMQAVRSRALLDGTENVDGREAWVLRVDDLSGIDGAEAIRSGRMTLWLDTGRHVPLRAEVEGETNVEGQWQPINITVVRADYTETDGVLFPGRSTTTITGPDAEDGSGMLSDSERSELREKIATGMRQLDKLPEQHRAMVQQMMGSRMAQLEAMMGPGPMEFNATLIEARVNAGPPAELAEQARTMFAKPRPTTVGPGAPTPVSPGDVLPWLED
ncbi:MAG: hypothetical protein U5R46_18900 [Gammaproteobacteria bacterium]|nr:hypothetical protein [Gammaproteobacteria bacterium]